MAEDRTTFNLYGYLSSRLGLGEAARNTARVLARRGETFRSADIGPVVDVSHERLVAEWNAVETVGDLKGNTNVFHLNPPELLETLARLLIPPADFALEFNALVPFWELPGVPDTWVPVLESVDAILAPSGFVADACRSASPATPIIRFPQAVYPPETVIADRQRWGMRPHAVSFLAVFDALSDLRRKNPWGAIDAFREAFPEREDVQLVLKVGSSATEGADRVGVAQLRDLAAVDRRILLIEDSLSRAEMWSLYASADAYVSLHRSEGLGLGLLEAMAVGTPVVATAWSGNMDFTTAADSLLVPFDLVPVSGTSIAAYGEREEGQRWAEPRLPDAIGALRRLADDRAFARQLGLAAHESADRVRERQLRGAAFVELGSLRRAAVTGQGRELRSGMLAAATSTLRRRKTVVSALRKLGLKAQEPLLPVPGANALLDSVAREGLVDAS
jgi:glycosyltransferase involved in cell wall biosynthesis